MRPYPFFAKFIAGLIAIIAFGAMPAGATTMIRAGIEQLTAENELVVHTKVVEFHSYWNSDHSFILTDVLLQPIRPLKGAIRGNNLVITLMGGSIGDLTTLIVGGPQLEPGSEYVLFLSHEDLPGVKARLTVRDLSQGVFAIVDGDGGRRAVSQALEDWLVPDARGIVDVAGGAEGFELEELATKIRAIAVGR